MKPLSELLTGDEAFNANPAATGLEFFVMAQFWSCGDTGEVRASDKPSFSIESEAIREANKIGRAAARRKKAHPDARVPNVIVVYSGRVDAKGEVQDKKTVHVFGVLS